MTGLLLRELGFYDDRAAAQLKQGSRAYQWALGRRLAPPGAKSRRRRMHEP
ncbi:MAG: hypothetical protein IVW53_14795 [Chloroflexi bacterium]|nr:hypothetical protein [Chloroflexota bacterium]MBF6606834.1 hypothetical protein [Chloroflexota bacterium]